MDRQEYLRLADDCLARVARWADGFDPDELECTSTDGVVTLEFADRARFVLNRQTAANQMWFAAVARAWHFDWNAQRRAWLDDAKEQEIAESEAATFSDEDDAVRLLTIHASKGLDFPIVFIPEIGAALPRTDRGVAQIALGAGDEPNILSVRIITTSDRSRRTVPAVNTRVIFRTRERPGGQHRGVAAVASAPQAATENVPCMSE